MTSSPHSGTGTFSVCRSLTPRMASRDRAMVLLADVSSNAVQHLADSPPGDGAGGTGDVVEVGLRRLVDPVLAVAEDRVPPPLLALDHAGQALHASGHFAPVHTDGDTGLLADGLHFEARCP